MTNSMMKSWGASIATWKVCLTSLNSLSWLLPTSIDKLRTYSPLSDRWWPVEITQGDIIIYYANHFQNSILVTSKRSLTLTMRCLRSFLDQYVKEEVDQNIRTCASRCSMTISHRCLKVLKISNLRQRTSMKMCCSEQKMKCTKLTMRLETSTQLWRHSKKKKWR